MKLCIKKASSSAYRDLLTELATNFEKNQDSSRDLTDELIKKLHISSISYMTCAAGCPSVLSENNKIKETLKLYNTDTRVG